MHDHSQELDETTVRPRAASLDHGIQEHVGRAAVEGRTDVLGTPGMLGLQRAVGNAGVTSLVEQDRSPVLDVVSGGGRPLEPDVRADMESRLGHDFGDVRIHDDGAAHTSAESVKAHAYTVGSSVVFQRDAYDPTSTAGRTTLAHELTHVVQQRSGPVDGTATSGGIRVSDPSDRFEREAAATAERAVAAPSGMPFAPADVGPLAEAPVQRESDEHMPVQRASDELLPIQREGAEPEKEEEEEPAAQGMFVQREGEEETDEEGAG